MNQITKKLITHIVAGYPDIKTSELLAETMSNSGVKFIEIQFPFSDPVADGPTIANAHRVAIENGTTIKKSFKLIENIKKITKSELIIMSYFNLVHAFGIEKFCQKTAKLGVYGLIVPDMPFDEERYEKFFRSCRKNLIHPIIVVSPKTSDSRLKKISKYASGFIYCMSVSGITGERKNLPLDTQKYIGRIKKYIKLPIALGFGISSREQIIEGSKYADFIVIGSKLINLFNSGGINSVKEFLS